MATRADWYEALKWAADDIVNALMAGDIATLTGREVSEDGEQFFDIDVT
jgi:hypothetical protein